MKERPILMQTDNVKAILEDRKTQTRRVDKFANHLAESYDHCWVYFDKKRNQWQFKGRSRFSDLVEAFILDCPYGQVGSRLWVREIWQVDDWNYPNHKEAVLKENLVFRADATTEEEYYNYSGWKSPLHLDKIFARIWLEITGVRVERLQEIRYNNRDLLAEGFVGLDGIAFKRVWDSLNAKRGYGWEKNPWVWVIEFKKVDK